MILLLYQLSYAAEGERHRDDDGPKKLGTQGGQVNRSRRPPRRGGIA